MSKTFQFNGTSYVSSLPFINTQTGNWFDVTPTGNETTDYNIGVSCAILLLKAMADDNKTLEYHPANDNAPVILPKIYKSIFKQGETLQTIASGFFFMFDVFLQSSAPKLAPLTDKTSYDDFILEIAPAIH